MARARKIAITVDPTLLAAAERIQRETAESRSAVFARALRELLRVEAHQRRVRQYVQAYRDHPEAGPEVDAMDRLGVAALESVDWRDR